MGRRRLLGSACGVDRRRRPAALARGRRLATGIAAAAARGDAGLVGSVLGAALGARCRRCWSPLAVAALLVGWAPRAAGLAWLLVAWELLAAMFGPLLGLPGWALRLSPFGWGAALPAEPFDAAATAGVLLVAVVLLGAALAGFRRRDVPG